MARCLHLLLLPRRRLYYSESGKAEVGDGSIFRLLMIDFLETSYRRIRLAQCS
jgi:hypothetical protein